MLAVEKGTTHHLFRRDDHRKPLDPEVSSEDKSILRELGKRIAEIGSLPLQEERKQMCSRLNKLKAVKPMVWLNDICWYELDVDGELGLKTSRYVSGSNPT